MLIKNQYLLIARLVIDKIIVDNISVQRYRYFHNSIDDHFIDDNQRLLIFEDFYFKII